MGNGSHQLCPARRLLRLQTGFDAAQWMHSLANMLDSICVIYRTQENVGCLSARGDLKGVQVDLAQRWQLSDGAIAIAPHYPRRLCGPRQRAVDEGVEVTVTQLLRHTATPSLGCEVQVVTAHD